LIAERIAVHQYHNTGSGHKSMPYHSSIVVRITGNEYPATYIGAVLVKSWSIVVYRKALHKHALIGLDLEPGIAVA
jgi:hypothetical protein